MTIRSVKVCICKPPDGIEVEIYVDNPEVNLERASHVGLNTRQAPGTMGHVGTSVMDGTKEELWPYKFIGYIRWQLRWMTTKGCEVLSAIFQSEDPSSGKGLASCKQREQQFPAIVEVKELVPGRVSIAASWCGVRRKSK